MVRHTQKSQFFLVKYCSKPENATPAKAAHERTNKLETKNEAGASLTILVNDCFQVWKGFFKGSESFFCELSLRETTYACLLTRFEVLLFVQL